MEFIDNTGHIFSQQTYDNNIGWELKDPEYVFWIDDSYTKSKLAINTFYIKQITPYINKYNILGKDDSNIDINDIIEIKISCNSNIFKLIKYQDINDSINNDKELNIYNLYNKNNNNTNNTNDNYIIYKENELIKSDENTDNEDAIFPFFVICMSTEADTLLTNILIDITYKAINEIENIEDIYTRSTVIRVGGVFTDESEKLIINAINTGVNLPKSILNAIYQSDIIDNNNDFSVNVSLYNEKLKEYLLNKTNIKNECGNYNGILNSLHWFGWGKHLKLVKLLKTDNKILKQYVQDSFNSDDDILSSFYAFRNTSFVSILFDENKTITDDCSNILLKEKQDWDNDEFIGEGLPLLEDLFEKYIKSNIDSKDVKDNNIYNNIDNNIYNNEIIYFEPYYLYNKSVILLKLAFLKYYFKKYFCPVHINVMSASVCHNEFMPDIKLSTISNTFILEKNILCQENCYVQIGNEKNITETFILNNNTKYIDANYCNFKKYNENYSNSINDIYESHELNFEIPIRFYTSVEDFINNNNNNINSNYTYNTVIRISKIVDDKQIVVFNKHLIFNQTQDNTFQSYVAIPRHSNITNHTDIYYWTSGSFKIDICCNGKWFSKEFNIILPKLNINIAELEYAVKPDDPNTDYFKQYYIVKKEVNGEIKDEYVLNAGMFEPNLVRVNASNYNDILDNYIKYKENNQSDECSNIIDLYSDSYNIPSHKIMPSYYNAIIYFDIDKEYQNNINDNNVCEYWNKIEAYMTNVNVNSSINIGLTFDNYIMKDVSTQKWYVVFISRETINNFKNKKLYNLSKLNMLINRYYSNIIIGNNAIKLYYTNNNCDYRFLINRMKISNENCSINGCHQFSHDKLLCCSIYNKLNADANKNVSSVVLFDIPFILKSKLTKFEFIPYSPVAGTNLSSIVKSKSNIGIMSLQENETHYLQGAYNIKVSYSIDGITTQDFVYPCRIKIS